MNFDITKFTKQIDQLANYFAQKLEVPAQKALEILHKEYIYQMVMNGIWFFIGLCLIIGTIILMRLDIKKEWYDDFEGVEWILWIIFLVTGAIMFFYNGTMLLHGLINPEWYIFTNIIKPLLS